MVENIIDLCILSLFWLIPMLGMVIVGGVLEKTGLLDILASVIWGKDEDDPEDCRKKEYNG